MEEVFAHTQTFLLLVLIRMIGFFSFIRLFAPFDPVKQNTVLQAGLAFAMTLPLVPDMIVALPTTPDLGPRTFIVETLVVALAGTSFAVLCSVPVKIVATIGEIVDNARGLSANGPLNPVTRDEATPLSSAASMVLSLLIFTFGWHLDVLEDFYAVDPARDLPRIAATLEGTASLWVHSVDILGILLTRALPLLGLLFAVDLGFAIATKNLKSSDMGGAENVLKILIVAAWVVLLLQDVLSPQGLVSLRNGFHHTVSPLRRLF